MMSEAITPEQRARERIDSQLTQAGWVVQSNTERDLSAASAIALREAPLAAGHGFADYLLYVDRRAIGVVEAKKEGQTLTGVEVQSEKYSVGLPPQLAAWHRPLPFLYQSTGVETRFTNALDPDPRSHTVFSFHRPETLLEWAKGKPGTIIAAPNVLDDADPTKGTYRTAPPTLQSRLRRMPPLDPSGMRDVQVRAITNLEKSLAENRPRALVQMIMGSGKSYTAVAEAYRLIKHAGAKRVLFLVDRGNLGKQAFGEFDQYITPEEKQKFTDLYIVQHLKSNVLNPSARVCISTIQRLYSILKGEPEMDDEADEKSAGDLVSVLQRDPLPVVYNPNLPPEFFDFVIIDECHRSIYNLWRQVLEYWDAYLIGLTATPSKQTFAFFNQNLVMEYGHAQAVADGVAVDFDVYEIETDITKNGALVEAGLWVDKRDRKTRRLRWQELDDDLAYTASDLDRAVVSEGQIRTVVRTFRDRLFTEIFPGRTEVPKTLIFAKDDSHADDIVRIVREEFGKGNEFCEKITYKTSTARIVDPITGAITYKSTGIKPDDLLSSFRNSYYPRIVVTVDMIATGTDIRPLEIVFFMRDVKSGNYFDQMKGRGSRVIAPDLLKGVTGDAVGGKSRYVIVDAVGVCKREHTDAPSLERKPSVSLKEILKDVSMGATNAEIVSTLASRMARLAQSFSPAQKASVEAAAGGRSFQSLVRALADAVDPDALDERARTAFTLSEDEEPAPAQIEQVAYDARIDAVTPFLSPTVRAAILDAQTDNEQVIDRVSQDTLLHAGASVEAKAKAAERVASFAAYIEQHRDEITALQVLYSRPHGSGPTFQQLKELAEKLAAPPQHLTPDVLWESYRAVVGAEKVRGRTAREKVADLVSLVRFALAQDDQLAPFEETVRARFAAWLEQQKAAGRVFSPEQVHWLELIRDHVASSLSVSRDDLGYVPFSGLGGLGAAYDVFGDALFPLLDEMNGVLIFAK